MICLASSELKPHRLGKGNAKVACSNQMDIHELEECSSVFGEIASGSLIVSYS